MVVLFGWIQANAASGPEFVLFNDDPRMAAATSRDISFRSNALSNHSNDPSGINQTIHCAFFFPSLHGFREGSGGGLSVILLEKLLLLLSSLPGRGLRQCIVLVKLRN